MQSVYRHAPRRECADLIGRKDFVMSSFASSRREERLLNIFSPEELITGRMYNMVLCGTVLYGIVVNFFLCVTVGDIGRYMNPIAFLLLYVVCCIAGIIMSSKSSNPVISFIGYNLIVIPIGLVISTVVEAYAKTFGVGIVIEAFLITMCITAAMTAFACLKPDLCAKFGYLLLPCLIGLVVAELLMLILGYSNNAFAWIGAVLFSLYIAYDVYRSQQFAFTVDNAIDSAVDIYLDIANLFLRILQILGRRASRSR